MIYKVNKLLKIYIYIYIYIYIFFEGYLHKHRLTEEEAIEHLKELLNGFKGMHEYSIMHRDFKAANVFINNGVFKIGDFGFAK